MDMLRFLVRALLWFVLGTLRLLGLGLRSFVKHALQTRRMAIAAKANTHGSARFASLLELWRGGVFGGDGLVLAKRFGRYVRFNREGYALIVAKTRAGKSGLIIPTLLTAPGAVIVSDPKGENHALTARARAKRGPVYTLNIIDPVMSDGFNPLDLVRGPAVDLGLHEADDAGRLADLLVGRDGDSGSEHWNDKARELIAALIIYVIRKYANLPELRTLAKIRSLTALGAEGLADALTDADDLGSVTLSEVVAGLRGAGGSDESKSVVSNADKALRLFSADRPAGVVTQRSDFDMARLNAENASLFIMVDEEKLPIYGTFLRVVLGCALNAITRDKATIPAHRTTFILDECAALGFVPQIEEGVGYLAAYARLMLVFQDFSQIERIYPRARSIIANAGALVAFGVRELETAKRLSAMIGLRTQLSRSAGISQSNTALIQHQAQQGLAETGRALLDPAEILRMPDTQALLFMDGVRHPIKATKIRYWKEWRFWGQWDRWRAASPTAAASAPSPPDALDGAPGRAPVQAPAQCPGRAPAPPGGFGRPSGAPSGPSTGASAPG